MTASRRKQPALFLDRDGVIIENRSNHVRAWQDVAFLPGALSALSALANSDYRVIVVTNQSVIGRGLVSAQDVIDIHQRIVAVVAQRGGRIDASYMCPHAPEDECACRKPQPGLLLQAANEWDIDLAQSIMIGDALSDLAAGQAAGVGQTVLVRTGRGRQQEQLLSGERGNGIVVTDDLRAALILLKVLPATTPRRAESFLP